MRDLQAKRRRGTALVFSMFTVVTVLSLGAAFMTLTVSNSKVTEHHVRQERARFLAEGGNEAVQKKLMQEIANYRLPTADGVLVIDGVPVSYVVTDIPGVRAPAQDADGVQTIYDGYEIATSATIDGYTARVHKIVDVGKTPIFQYAVFYNNDLEIQPGPTMTISGRVHTNRDMYIGTGSNSTLTIDSYYLRAIGSMYLHRKNNGTINSGRIRAKIMGTSSYHDIERKSDFDSMGVPSYSGFDSNFCGYDENLDGDFNDEDDLKKWRDRSTEIWQGTVLTGEHGVHEAVVPSVASIKRYEETESGTGGDYVYNDATCEYVYVSDSSGTHDRGYYYEQSGLSIIDGRAYDESGNDITNLLPPGTISSASMYDGRENKTVWLTEIDMSLLNTTDHFPSNGLLYAARSDSSPSQPNGIRFKNASEVKHGLTVVSEDAVYTWGDYNTVDKKPAAIITDAMNILSNSWDDTKGAGTLPTATETTVNAAFISGNQDTTWGHYNGGFENLPRFHEKWSNVKCNLVGSFVNLWLSEVANGSWSYGGDNYKAPKRTWSFDQDFTDPDKLPPYTPVAVSIERVAWWSS